MKKPNSKLMRFALDHLSDNWGTAIGACLVFGIITGSTYPAAIIIGGPMALGMAIFSLALARKKELRFSMIFDGFQKFGKALEAYVLMLIYVVLWSLLLIIPGIIAAIGYSQTFYILADDDTITGSEALRKSKAMMDGYKWKYFGLQMRFLGWAFLCVLTLVLLC